jgi:hypothetical protein
MEDQIDFACSNLWRDFYYETGLTNHPSPNYISSRDRALLDALADIRDAFTSLLEGEPVLPHRQAPSRPFYKPPTPPPTEDGKRGIPL